MSMLDTWSIWMATFSFMIGGSSNYRHPERSRGASSLLETRTAPSAALRSARDSVKPPPQVLQQARYALAHRRTPGRAFDMEETLESGNRRAPLVQPGVELAGLEQEFRPVRRDRQHAVERLCGRGPVLAVGQPQEDVVLQPEQHVAVRHRIEMLGMQLGLGPQHLAQQAAQVGGVAHRAVVKRIDHVPRAVDADADQEMRGEGQALGLPALAAGDVEIENRQRHRQALAPFDHAHRGGGLRGAGGAGAASWRT